MTEQNNTVVDDITETADESTTRAAFLIDDGAVVLTWNEGCEQLFGIDSAAILQQPLAALLTAPCAAKFARHWQSTSSRREVRELQLQLARPDGSRWPAPRYSEGIKMSSR